VVRQTEDATLARMPETEPFAPPVLKHLEFIQAVIARLAGNSFLIKGWALTVTGAFYGFAVHGSDWRLAALGLLPAMTFWGLDGYFLRQERLFRSLYNAVRKDDGGVDAFCMRPLHHPDAVGTVGTRLRVPMAWAVRGWLRVSATWTLLGLYVPLLVVGVALASVLAATPHALPPAAH
jgi:hypothetical protein